MNGAEKNTEQNGNKNTDSDMQTDHTNESSTTPNVEIVRQQRFEVAPRYTDLKFIGEGAYGKKNPSYFYLLIIFSFLRYGCFCI